MLDPMDVIGPMADRLLALARELEAISTPGEPIDTDSSQYKRLFAAMEESKATLQKTEEELDRQIAAELGDLQKDLEAQQAELDKEVAAAQAAAKTPIPEAELPEGHRAFAFENAHTPPAAELNDAIQRLLRRRQVAAASLAPEPNLGSVWNDMPAGPTAATPPAPKPPAAPTPQPTADEGLGSLWSRWIVEPASPPPERRDDEDWEKSSQIEGL